MTGYWIFDDECKEHGHCPYCGYGSVDLVDGEPHNYCTKCGARLTIEFIDNEVKSKSNCMKVRNYEF